VTRDGDKPGTAFVDLDKAEAIINTADDRNKKYQVAKNLAITKNIRANGDDDLPPTSSRGMLDSS